MRIKALFILCFFFMSFMAGCSLKKNNTQDTNHRLRDEKKVDSLVITPKKVTVEKETDTFKILKISFKIKNESKEVRTIAANDFIIKDGEDYYYMGEGINFAKTIQLGKTINGNGYYKVPKITSHLKLMYKKTDGNTKNLGALVITK